MKKNRIYALTVASCLSAVGMAQNQYDALTYMNSDLNGTARYVGMGGAMNALGADISTISSNPAGIGLFRKNDASISFGFNSNEATMGANRNAATEKRTVASFDQVGFVWSTKIGNETSVRYMNIGLNYHKRANFNRQMFGRMQLNGASVTQQMAKMVKNSGLFTTGSSLDNLLDSNNPYTSRNYWGLPYLGAMGLRVGFNDNNRGVSAGLVDYSYDDNDRVTGIGGWNASDGEFYSREQGGVNQFDLNIAFNIRDRFYFGATLGLYDLNYNRYSSYAESLYLTATDNGNTYHDYGTLRLDNYYRADGTGVDMKFGFIARPFEYSPFRIGFSVSTPIWYSMTDKYSAVLSSTLKIESKNGDIVSGTSTENLQGYLNPQYVFDYAMTTPWKVNVSAGTVVGKVLAIDAEYEFEKYSGAKLRERSQDDYYYGTVLGNELSGTAAIKETLKPVHTFRIGAEANVEGFCVRAGYNFHSSPINTTSYKNIAATDETRTNPEYINLKNRQAVTCGVGYHGKHFYADVAYKYDFYKGDFYAFDSEDLVATQLKNKRHQMLFTVGARF